MTDLIEALRNPLLVTDERFDLTREAADEIERLQGLFDKWHTIAAEKHAEIGQLEAALKPFAEMAMSIELEHPGWYHNAFMFTEPRLPMQWLIDARLAHERRAALAGKVQP